MRYSKIYPASLCFCVFLAAVGVMLGDPAQIIPGIRTIILMEDALITDYIQIAGISAAFVNSALVTLISVGLLWLCREAPNGFTMVELGLMAGFALFGKNIANIWPIIAGTFLYAKVRREPFGKYVSIALLATALAPVVSYVAIDNGFGNLWWGIGVGVLIGFVLPPLSAYTYKIQNGMNLYNMGFACGVLAMILVPVMSSLGADPNIASHWSTGNNLPLALALGVLCAVLILTGLFLCGRPAWAAWAGYRRLLLTTGRAPSDYLRMFGAAPVLLNTGINGLIGMLFILATGGDLNGPTLGGIFGGLIQFNTEGLDFVMTAMFVVIFLEQWLKDRDHTSALVGLAASAACLALFGPDDFIIPAMLAILGSLTLLRGTLERKGALA